jgi:hypothetical protein
MARRRRLASSSLVFGIVLSSCGFFPTARPGSVEVTQLFLDDDGISLGVASCNAAPDATVSDLTDGQYLVEVRTTQKWERGEACLDVVMIDVDPALARFEIVDLANGKVFQVPPVVEDLPPSVDMDGVWRMIEVNGEQVEVGVNTIEIPEVEIEAGFLSGRLGCTGGGAELLIEGARVRAFLQSESQLCNLPDGGDEMVLTERVLSSMLESEVGFDVQRTGSTMVWQFGTELVLFELADGRSDQSCVRKGQTPGYTGWTDTADALRKIRPSGADDLTSLS